jgi:hypothetical protein
MAIKAREQAIIDLVINGQQAGASLRELNGAYSALRASVSRLREADNPALYREQVANLNRVRAARDAERASVEGQTRSINQQAEASRGFFKDFIAGFSQIGAITGGVALGTMVANFATAGVNALKSLVGAVIQTYATFEKFDIVLTNTLGDKGSSRRALNMLQKFAAETPFALDELTGSFVKLANRGIIPTMEELRKMGDLTASQGKSFDQLTEAILDATTGEFERLKEFGIRGTKSGDIVKLSFKGVTEEVANTEEAIQKAILKFGEMEGVAGGMQKMSESVGGGLSNMGDNWNRVLTAIGSNTGGMIFSAVSSINEYLNFLVEAFKSTEQRIQETADDYAANALKRYTGKPAADQKALYEGSKMELQYYMDEVDKAEKKLAIISKQRGTGDQREDLKRSIDDYNLNIAKERTFIESVDAYNRQTAEADKKRKEQQRQQDLADQKKAADEYQRTIKQYMADVESVRNEYIGLTAAAKNTTVDELDGQLALLDAKYDKIVAKLKKLASDPKVTALLKKELLGDIAGINTAGGLRDQEKDNTRRTAFTKKNSAGIADQFKSATSSIDDVFGQGQSELDGDMATDLNGISSSDPAIIEAQRLDIQAIYAQKKFDLEQKHLEDLKTIYQAYGVSTGELDRKIAENTIKENERAAKKKIADDKAYIAAKTELQQLEMSNISEGAQFLESVFDKRSALYKAALIVDKTVAIANVVMATEVAIAKFAASVAALGPFGAGLATAYATSAHISEGISIATIIKSAVDGLGGDKSSKKAAKGGTFEGPGHDQGGLNVVDPRTGETVVNVEGGEPWMVLSRETRRNNGALINQLLFNSMYRNGARVDVPGITRGIQTARNGGAFNSPAAQPAAASNSDRGIDTSFEERLSRTETHLQDVAGLLEAEAKRPVELNTRLLNRQSAKDVQLANNANA